jgi:adenosylcobinamide-phosphate synthase
MHLIGFFPSIGHGVLAVLFALAADKWLGEPRLQWHPVVWMGRYLELVGHRIQEQTQQGLAYTQRGRPDDLQDKKALLAGAGFWILGSMLVVFIAALLQKGLLLLSVQLDWFGFFLGSLLIGLFLKPLLSWEMLRTEAFAVEDALSAEPDGSLENGRNRLKWLVSRDVSQLSEVHIRESVIESLAENLNDSVVAPIFWFVLLGLPGAALYRFANTADAMWGYPGMYQGRNWQWAGKWAARADDVLSWVPARITAVLLLLSQGGIPFKRLIKEASKTPSPNSGWPMAAMSIALDVRLEKPGVYVLNQSGKLAESHDVNQAINLSVRALALLMIFLIFSQVLVSFEAML